MANKILPSVDTLRELLRYEEGTGKLFWKARPSRMFNSERASRSWNAKYANSEAFTYKRANDGYKQGAVHDVSLLAHRVVWAICNGEWPENLIDHINGISDDNRLCNLRLATQSENLKNRGRQRNNKSGFKGVYLRSDTEKWSASIWSKGVETKLGSRFNTAEDAHKAYCKAAQELHGEFARTK